MRILTAVLAAALATAPALAEVTATKLGEDRYRLDLTDADASQALNALAAAAGLRVEGGLAAPDRKLEGIYQGRLNTLLDRILAGQGRLVVYSAGAGAPGRIVLTSAPGGGYAPEPSVAAGLAAPEPAPAPAAEAARPTPAPVMRDKGAQDGVALALQRSLAPLSSAELAQADPQALGSARGRISMDSAGRPVLDEAAQAEIARMTKQATADLSSLVQALRDAESQAGAR